MPVLPAGRQPAEEIPILLSELPGNAQNHVGHRPQRGDRRVHHLCLFLYLSRTGTTIE